MTLRAHHLKPSFLLRAIRSVWASRKVTGGRQRIPVRINNPFLKIKISVAPTARFICNGILRIEAWQGGNEPVTIKLREQSELIIDGDFIIGNGTRIIVDSGASLYIGGKKNESASGITEKSLIMVRKKVHIGADCIIAWNVYLTDCDWHAIYGQDNQADVVIGEHVWIACNASILKGANIGDNCIVGAHSVISKKSIPAGSLIAGIPGQILANNVRWNRDMLNPEEILETRATEGRPENR